MSGNKRLLCHGLVAGLVALLLVAISHTATADADLVNVGASDSSPTTDLKREDSAVDQIALESQATSSLNQQWSVGDATGANAKSALDQLEHPLNPASSANKFRVNVSNICEKDRMQITVRLSKPFYGLIHAKDKRKKPACYVDGTGNQAYTFHISYTQVGTDQDYCGVVAHPPASPGSSGGGSLLADSIELATARRQLAGANASNQTLSLVLVVRLHKTIEFSDDRYFLLSCANRCSRPDCSTLTSTRVDSPSVGQRGAPLLSVSESIVTPRLFKPKEEASAQEASSAALQQQLHGPLKSVACDRALTVKLHWLVRICIILGFLLVALAIVAGYLCCQVRDNKRQEVKANCDEATSSSQQASKPSPQQRAETKMVEQQTHWPVDSQDEHAGYLLQQQQQQLIDNRKAQQHYINQQQQQQQQQLQQYHQQIQQQQQYFPVETETIQTDPTEPSTFAISNRAMPQIPPVVVGRSLETFGRLQRRPTKPSADHIVRRCRSIGGSSLVPQILDMQQQQQQQPMAANQPQAARLATSDRFDSDLRAKSRSQTTIFYEQGQDPFKTVPFSYTRSGYISANEQARDLNNNSSDSISNYDLLVGHQMRPPHEEYGRREQRLSCGLLPMHHQVGLQTLNSYAVTSQFDPQASRQLADMIQQKHRRQVEQAGLTAATIQAQNDIGSSQYQKHQH